MSVLVTLVLMSTTLPSTQASPARLEQDGSQWKLLRDAKPFFVKGVGGSDKLDELKAYGGNAFRTWGADNLKSKLDEAHSKGIAVQVGIWLGHKRHGFDWNNPKSVKDQYEMVRARVLEYKDHPAVLIWALGNEMEIDNDTPELWKAIGELAKLVKSLDKNHPVMTVVAEIGGKKLEYIKEYAPDIDILGVNSYGGMPTLAIRLKAAGWTKPYMVTEFGPLGPWEAGKTEWGASLEWTSSEKAKFYADNYQRTVASQPGFCLGSYAFLWGEKQETTPTWFGMMLRSGELLETADVVSHAWTGKWPANRAPQVQKFDFDFARKRGAAGTLATAEMVVFEPNNEPLRYRWEIRREIARAGFAGEGEVRPEPLTGIFTGQEGAKIQFRLPKEPGAYRLYAYAFDGKGKAATANEPFFVNR